MPSYPHKNRKMDPPILSSDICVGNILRTLLGYKYHILSVGRDNTGKIVYIIKFLDTGYITTVDIHRIKGGMIKDPYHPVIAGVGCLGKAPCKIDNIKLREYSVWSNMICRCYDPNASRYHIYGARGVTVCKRWHCYENFYNDIKYLPGYTDKEFYSGQINLDKDILQPFVPTHLKVYSPFTCVFVPVRYNNYHRNNNDNFYGVGVLDTTTNQMMNFDTTLEVTKALSMSHETLQNKLKSGELHRGYQFLPKPYYTIPDYIIQAEQHIKNTKFDEDGLRIVYRRVNNGLGFCAN